MDKEKILDNINQWTQNCDTKASIILATLGVFITMIATSDITKAAINIIRMIVNEKTPCGIVYLIMLLIGLVLMVIGIYKLIRVLIPKLDHTKDSVMFFSHISKFPDADSYKIAFESQTNQQMNDDLLYQIYAASRICARKFENQKKGLILSFVGLAIVFFWLVVGFIVYYL